MNKMNKKLGVFDAETDPFLHGRTPKPFSIGFYNDEGYIDFWGDNCLKQFVAYLETLEEPHVIYAHNGGKFDFWFLYYIGVLNNPIKIINGRITKAQIGIHEIRDSYSIIPVPLAAYQKDKIDYNKFEKLVRENHKDEILKYLKSDCVYLYELVEKFIERFGLNLTIGGTAIKTLQSYHPFENTHQSHDERFRKYYFGGRVQFFESGILEGNFKVYDVNSMYPYVMSEKQHPVGDKYISVSIDKLNKKGFLKGYKKDYPFFIHFVGKSDGALPLRTDDGLNFEYNEGEFFTTSHELQVGLKYNLIEVDEIYEILVPRKTINFKAFIKHFMKEKVKGKETKNKTLELFSKLIMNSSYGKFGQSPLNFFDYHIRFEGEAIPDRDEWELYLNSAKMEIWRRPSPKPLYYDVSVAASITGAARAVLLEAIANAERPVYCDTDSLICEKLNGVELHESKLGAWDCEGKGNKLAIAGKKLYALFQGRMTKNNCSKMASKGAKLNPSELVKLAKGVPVDWKSDAPNFKLTGEVKFIQRTLRKRT